MRTWNGLIAIQDLRNYYMNNVRGPQYLLHVCPCLIQSLQIFPRR